MSAPLVRSATRADGAELVQLWVDLFAEAGLTDDPAWRDHAGEWFDRVIAEPDRARVSVVEVDGRIVATALGTLELGAPNPNCPRGRTVRLANVFTVREHRGHGYGAAMVDDIVGWAREVGADRVDLSATADGVGVYERAGFVRTSAPRMKLVL